MHIAIALVLACAVAVYGQNSTEHQQQYGFINERIVGGFNAAPNSAPWIVSIQWGLVTPRQHCGGSIISNDWVITAAHCLGGHTNVGVFILSAGRHNLGLNEGTEQRRNINRARAFGHPLYPGGGVVAPFDIGMIHVNPVFTFNNFVRAIALPTQPGFLHSGAVVLHGWGSTSNTRDPIMPNILQQANKVILPFAQCAAIFGPNSPLHNTNLCTGPINTGLSACGGDSGGPLVQNGQIIAVVSWGLFPCGGLNAPSVFVRTTAFLDWIAATRLR